MVLPKMMSLKEVGKRDLTTTAPPLFGMRTTTTDKGQNDNKTGKPRCSSERPWSGGPSPIPGIRTIS
jgi:hypothetical protein